MNRARLLKLADFLDTVPVQRFDLADWRCDPEVAWGPRNYVDDVQLKHGCGTTGCAVGWACSMPEFQAKGLSFRDGCPEYVQHPEETPLRGWFAPRAFFGLGFAETNHLFDGFQYPDGAGPAEVAARIRELVKEKS